MNLTKRKIRGVGRRLQTIRTHEIGTGIGHEPAPLFKVMADLILASAPLSHLFPVTLNFFIMQEPVNFRLE